MYKYLFFLKCENDAEKKIKILIKILIKTKI